MLISKEAHKMADAPPLADSLTREQGRNWADDNVICGKYNGNLKQLEIVVLKTQKKKKRKTDAQIKLSKFPAIAYSGLCSIIWILINFSMKPYWKCGPYHTCLVFHSTHKLFQDPRKKIEYIQDYKTRRHLTGQARWVKTPHPIAWNISKSAL